MAAVKACKSCKMIVGKGDTCPICHGDGLTTNWRGYVVIFDHEKSEIAKKMGITVPGKYALRMGK